MENINNKIIEFDEFMEDIKPNCELYTFDFNKQKESGEFWKEKVESISRVQNAKGLYYIIETETDTIDIYSIKDFNKYNYFKNKKDMGKHLLKIFGS